MKLSTLFAATLFLSVSLFCTQTFAQSKNIASSKEKQAALDKQKAHQAEMKKKYNSLTPEQAAEAKRKAEEYKKGGYKGQPGQGTTTNPASKPAQPAVTGKKTVQTGKTNTNNTGKTKPILLDANGKPLTKTSPSATGKTEVSPNKVTPSVKPSVNPAKKIEQKVPSAKSASEDVIKK